MILMISHMISYDFSMISQVFNPSTIAIEMKKMAFKCACRFS